MVRKEMESVVTYAFNDSKKNGLWQRNEKWLRTKWIHFHKDCGYSAQKKMKIARQLTGERQVAETTKIITTAITELEKSGIKPTQANVIRKLEGIRSARTIKNYWKVIMLNPTPVEQGTANIQKIQFAEPLKVSDALGSRLQDDGPGSSAEFYQGRDCGGLKTDEIRDMVNRFELRSEPADTQILGRSP